MRDLQEYYEKAKRIVQEAGFEVPKNVKLEVVSDSSRFYGRSYTYPDESAIIQIAKVFLHEQIPECGLMSTLIHELAHVITVNKYKKNGHGSEWQNVMHQILQNHPEYDDHSADNPNGIGSSRLCGLTPENLYKSGYKDICYCPNCGEIWYRRRSGSKILKEYVGLSCPVPDCGAKITHYNPPKELQKAVSK